MATKPAMSERLDVEQALALIEKGQQLAGHFPDDDALSRARAVFSGESTEAEAIAELDATYAPR